MRNPQPTQSKSRPRVRKQLQVKPRQPSLNSPLAQLLAATVPWDKGVVIQTMNRFVVRQVRTIIHRNNAVGRRVAMVYVVFIKAL